MNQFVSCIYSRCVAVFFVLRKRSKEVNIKVMQFIWVICLLLPGDYVHNVKRTVFFHFLFQFALRTTYGICVPIWSWFYPYCHIFIHFLIFCERFSFMFCLVLAFFHSDSILNTAYFTYCVLFSSSFHPEIMTTEMPMDWKKTSEIFSSYYIFVFLCANGEMTR